MVPILNIWILPERPLAVSLDKGNAGAGDEMGHLRFHPSTVKERPPASVTINSVIKIENPAQRSYFMLI